MSSGLKRKLSRLKGAGPGGRTDAGGDPASASSPADEHQAGIQRLRELMAEATSRGARVRADQQTQGPRFDAPLPGELRDTAFGPLQVVEQWLEPNHHHGRVPVRTALDVDPEVVSRLALTDQLDDVAFENLLILDTETTGLSTGAGTLPFLVGLAFFDEGSLKVEQLFLRGPGQEVPLLQFLAERIRSSSVLLTYNGKTFDWPLLRTRFIMNRVPMPKLPPHLDLLHCARRIYKRRLERVKLIQIEEAVLGFHREDDVSGAEIPQLYLDYLRGGDAGPLTGVIEHNANDLIALAAVLGKMSAHFERVHKRDDPRDHLGYALLAERAKDPARADEFAEAAANGGGDEETSFVALMLRARLARRRRDWCASEQLLLSALEIASPIKSAAAHLALAKLLEHRLKDFARALRHCELSKSAEAVEAHEKRMARVTRRLARSSGT